jgi:hypothetical protein
MSEILVAPRAQGRRGVCDDGAMSRSRAALCAVFLVAACNAPSKLTVYAGADSMDAVASFVAMTPGDLVVVKASVDPAGELAHADGPSVALTIDRDCGDCFTLEAVAPERYRVHGGNLLGVQYGLAQLLEEASYRFYHPRQSLAPQTIVLPQSSFRFGSFAPAMALRGLHLHTLHPIEAHFDFWQPSPEHLDGAKRVIDWLVKNRGNYLQWPALDDITKDPTTFAAWHDHTRAILDYAHSRGVKVGIGMQLFDSGSLQNSYVLLKTAQLSGDTHAQATASWQGLLGDLPFDRVNLSFGEFFGADPSVFVTQLDVAFDTLQALRPGMEMAATIHVGNAPSQHVQYMGQNLLYYFLVQFANPKIVPWVHTVMYYDLFEDTGGAYQHNDFSPHRQFLLDHLQSGQRVAYFPESAYWVAFDDSVPTYLPIYLYTRWLDVADIDRQSPRPLNEHVLFSSGWEWGYWQNDYVTLRMNYSPPDRWQAPLEEAFAPYGAKGQALAVAINSLASLQHDALIGQRLAPYLAGNDFLLDTGAMNGIISQPTRPSFAQVAALPPDQRAAFVANTLGPLDQLADATASIAGQLDAIGLSRDDPWYGEIRDGVEVDLARARFIAALYHAVVAQAGGAATDAPLAAAEAALADAQATVKRRHAHLHDPSPGRLLADEDNATIYKYGYLNEADTLCYWQRERAQARQQVLGSGDMPPGCVLGF